MHVASHTAAPPARCSGLCEDVEVGALAAEADGLEPVAAQLSALPPDASLPVSAAVLVCMAPDGYLTAPALAAAAPALADDVRARFARLRDSARAPPEHGNSSYSRPACCSPAQNNEARKVVPNCCAELRRSSEAIGSNHRWQKGDWPHRGPLPYTLAILCSSPPCRPARVPFSAPKRDRMPEHGSIPCDEASRIPPQSMPIALRRPACWPDVAAKVVERAWVRMAREAGAEGQVVPQQWLAHTTATGVPADDRRRLDLVVYEATANGGALCCDATLVSPLTRTGHPHPCTVEVDEAALKVAERRKHCTYPELARGRPQKLLVLGSEIGGHWSTAAQGFVRDLVRLRALPPPPAVRGTVSSGWASRWWGALSVAVQLAVARTALGRAWPAAPLPGPSDGPALDRVLDLAADAGPSR
ncbi:unnamed protein product, partial [Symbiodinium sp. KB8]